MGEPVTITMKAGNIIDVDFEQWILNEIADKAFTRSHVADTYAILIQKGCKNIAKINQAIKSRWSASGLQWIKTRAWRKVNAIPWQA